MIVLKMFPLLSVVVFLSCTLTTITITLKEIAHFYVGKGSQLS